MHLTLLGSGDAAGVPVYGCDCPACTRARILSEYRRTASSAQVLSNGQQILIDAGQSDLAERFPPGSLTCILLTHYHMDHVHGLFHLRWGVDEHIPVIGPDDPAGCDDLRKHPGILDFSTVAEPFETFELGDIQVTPLPLNHSRPTLGYYLLNGHNSLAYLTDTKGLPAQTLSYLMARPPSLLVVDCSFTPGMTGNGNHNNIDDALAIHRQIQPGRTLLTHIGHELDSWLMENDTRLPDELQIAYDDMSVVF